MIEAMVGEGATLGSKGLFSIGGGDVLAIFCCRPRSSVGVLRLGREL